MQTLFYNNYSKSDTAFTGSLDTSDVHQAITLHPIKKTPYMYRLHNYLQSTAIMDLQMKTMQLYRSILKMRQLLNEEDDHRGHDTDPQLQSLGLQPGLLKYTPDSHEDLIPWNFFGKYWYSANANAPRHGMLTHQTQALDHIASQVMGIINSNSMKVGRTINFKEILYGYSRVVPLYGVDYVLDLLLMYHKHSKSKRFPVRRHAYLQQSFGKLEIRVDNGDAEPSLSAKKVKVDSSVEKLKNGISQTLFGIQRNEDAPSSRHPLQQNSKHKETIHFILPLAGRLEILQRFMENFERMCLMPGENVQMIIVLFRLPENDPSEEIEKLIARYSSKYPQSTLKILHANGDFSRGLALDLGASQLPPDALMFFVDVDMHISPGFLTRCRLNTIRGRQVYYPVVFGQYSPEVTYGPGTKPESKLAISKETGFFRHYGYGLVCLYNSDLAEVGGLDSSIIGWGMEDVDLYQKFATSNVTIFRAPDPALIHIYHPVVCDPELESKQYQMCMGSKVNQYGSSWHLAKLLQKDKPNSSEETESKNR
ncbi:chondroitin sulfate synthase 1-like [Patiria miniata]|uniref:Hexosyltransferase n=1 Tax=Patiria miniata TaxID=46514 RepID=A0A914BPD6_PATMI|nr:chondroitin sulfate synthase 1-like [Patiria miniata]